MRQPPQPLAGERRDLLRRQPIAERLGPPGIATRENAVVEGLEGDPALAELPLHILVAVEAELGVVGEVGAELQKERAEVFIHGVEVEVVDHRRRAHEPGIGLAGRGVAALLGPQHGRLLLGSAHEHHALGGGEVLQVLRHHVVLPLTLLERDERDLVRLHEGVNGGDEPLADGIHQRRRGDGLAAVTPEEGGDPALVLQPRHVGVQVHPVDALDFQRDVLPQNLGDGPW